MNLFLRIGLKSFLWRKKKIPKTAILYRRVHFSLIFEDEARGNKLMPNHGAFRDSEYEISCDWDKYSTPQKSLNLISKELKKNDNGAIIFKNKDDFFICKLLVEDIENKIPNQNVTHQPNLYYPSEIGKPNNRSHSVVIGIKDKQLDVKRRLQLATLSEWAIFDEDRYYRLKSK